MNQETVETIEEAREELKRAEHLLFVTLKYTRTNEVMKNHLTRLINTYEKGFEALLIDALEKQKINQIPVAKLIRTNILSEVYFSKELDSYINFYKTMRVIHNADSEKREEYRKNVAILTPVTEEILIETNVDDLYVFFMRTHEFIEFVFKLVKE
mgnify:FL=1